MPRRRRLRSSRFASPARPTRPIRRRRRLGMPLKSPQQQAKEFDGKAGQQPAARAAWPGIFAGRIDKLDHALAAATLSAGKLANAASNSPRKSHSCRIGQFACPGDAAAAVNRQSGRLLRIADDSVFQQQPSDGLVRRAGESESFGPASGSSAIADRRWCRSGSAPIAAAALRAFSTARWPLPDSNRRHRR